VAEPQLNLFHRKLSMQEKYDIWKQKNYDLFLKFFEYADLAASRGKKFGAALIWERIRWYCRIESEADDFKCNNNWRAYLMRDWQKDRIHLAHLVETRELKS